MCVEFITKKKKKVNDNLSSIVGDIDTGWNNK